jgi:hypothetical protein
VSVASRIADQILFIDSGGPDLQNLLRGVAPGAQPFVLDPSNDGVPQIPNLLAADKLSCVSSIAASGSAEQQFIADRSRLTASTRLHCNGANSEPRENFRV